MLIQSFIAESRKEGQSGVKSLHIDNTSAVKNRKIFLSYAEQI